MESKTAFVRSKRRVELHAEATVDMNLAFVVFPSDTKLDDSFWDCGDFERCFVFRVLLEKSAVLKCRCKLCDMS